MKKLLLVALAAVALPLFASMDTGDLRVISAVSPQTVSSGSAVTNSVQIFSMKGICEVLTIYKAANTNCEVTATLITTNRVDGGWKTVNSAKLTGVTDGVIRVPFIGAYLPKDLLVAIEANSADATVGSTILTYR